MSSSTPLSRISQLSKVISESVGEIDTILTTKGLPSPSFDEDSLAFIPDEASSVADKVLDAAAELRDLLLDPLNLVYKYNGHNNPVALQAIARFGIASMVPSGSQVSFEEIATRTNLEERVVCRILRHAMTMHVFQEPKRGMVSHTRASKLFADPVMNDWLQIGTEEMWPAATKMLDAIQKWPASSEPNETGFTLSNGSSESIYSIIGADPERASRFANAMTVFATRPDYDPIFLIDNYDWGSLGQAHVVDIGGARGHVATCLLERYNNLKVTVQDMENIIENAQNEVPLELRGRINFVPHDLFSAQELRADAYLLRWVLHNWADKYCVRILRALVPALKDGARIIIQETCMPQLGSIPRWREKDLRSEDLNMKAIFNSQERTTDEWTALLKEAGPNFVLKNVIEPRGSALGILEVIWYSNTAHSSPNHP